MSRIFVVGIAVSLLSPLGAFADRSFAEVTLTYNEGQEPCITATPDPVMVYWNQRPKKVKWISGSGKEYQWEIDWKGSADGQPNYFGKNFKIKRGEQEKGSDKPNRHGRTEPGASWSYVIRVYETSPSIARGRLLCELDPAVDWGD
jgi:hypothetical protein